MNKKGQIDMNNPVGAIIGIFVFIIIGLMLVTFLSTISNVISQDQCKPYQEEAERLKEQAKLDNVTITQKQISLEQCKNDYMVLEGDTITKKDFEEVKSYFNLTHNTINTINKKIDGIDRIYNFYTIKNYSLALNLILGIELLSFIFIKNEFLQWIWGLTFGKKRKNKEKEELENVTN